VPAAGEAGAATSPPPPPHDPRAHGPEQRPRIVGALVVAARVAAIIAAAVTVPLTLALSDRDAAPATPTAADTAADEAGDAADAPAPPPLAEGADIADIADALLPSVARVDVTVAQGTGSGSAVVYRPDGYLLTNEHVVRGASAVQVTLPDGTTLDAEVVGGDEFHDLAVLRIDPGGLPAGELPAPAFADEQPRIGETAIAIGSPFELDGSVTAGIVSGLGRSIPGTPLRDLIQTDAPINPGNSGGALVNARGEVIGINTAILGGAGGAAGNIGIGFAIPITNARPLADQLIDQGFVQYAQLGVQAQNIDPGVAEVYGLGVSEGALVLTVVPGSGAEAAGLERGDIITALGGEPIAGVLDLVGAIRLHEPGADVEIEFVRRGETQTTTATLDAAEQGS
jgi:putative serine protease PepD